MLSGSTTHADREAMARGVRFLLDEQALDGGWPDADSFELPLVDAEIMLALMLARTPEGHPVPLPGSSARSAPRAAGSAPYATPLP